MSRETCRRISEIYVEIGLNEHVLNVIITVIIKSLT